MNTMWRGQIRAKFGGICGWKMGESGWKARSTCYTRNPRIKSNKTYHTNKSQKKLGAIFVGNFRIRDKINKNKARNTTGRLRNRDQCGSRYQDDVGWNPNRGSFTFGVDPTGKHEERAEEHKGNHGDKREKHSTNK